MQSNKELNDLFKELKEEVRQKGLLDKTPIRGAIELVIVIALTLLSLYSVEHFAPLVTVGLFVLTIIRATFVAHDLIHGQYFSRKTNRKVSYLFANGIMGISMAWWDNKHNVLHHTFTNIIGKDTDITMAGGAFIGKKEFSNFFHTYQHYLFWLVIPFIYFSFWVSSVIFNYQKKYFGELFIMGLNLLIPAYILATHGALEGTLMLLGIYMIWSIWFGAVIMTNHLGLEMFSEEEYKNFTWLELQTRTSRNVRGGKFVHWFYGGLNTQVEHHLYPKAPRFHLLEVAKITEDFCVKHNIAYYNITPAQTYAEIFNFLKKERLQPQVAVA
jgi:fatty acid desaturase